jgi:hypothetical protein
MTLLGPDRKILRAFYTQYVAVLLIMLVFFVAAFQSPTHGVSNTPEPVRMELPARATLAGPLTFNPFVVGDSVAQGHAQLTAIAAVLKKHDVQASIVFEVARSPLEMRESDIATISARVDALERFFHEQQVPVGAAIYRIEQATERLRDGVSVRLYAEGRSHG